jgi:hypothetical protein
LLNFLRNFCWNVPLCNKYLALHENSECFKKSLTNVTVWRVLRRLLNLKAYNLSVVQHLMDADKVARKKFCMQMFHKPRSVWPKIDYRSVTLPVEVKLNYNYPR